MISNNCQAQGRRDRDQLLASPSDSTISLQPPQPADIPPLQSLQAAKQLRKVASVRHSRRPSSIESTIPQHYLSSSALAPEVFSCANYLRKSTQAVCVVWSVCGGTAGYANWWISVFCTLSSQPFTTCFFRPQML